MHRGKKNGAGKKDANKGRTVRRKQFLFFSFSGKVVREVPRPLWADVADLAGPGGLRDQRVLDQARILLPVSRTSG